MKCLNSEELSKLIGTTTQITWHPGYHQLVHPHNRNDKFWIKSIDLGPHTFGVLVVDKSKRETYKVIDPNGLGCVTKLPVFTLADVENTEHDIKDLKLINSRPDTTKCAKCGGPLKMPFPNIKYCPVCEP
jgi:hypothetical protein